MLNTDKFEKLYNAIANDGVSRTASQLAFETMKQYITRYAVVTESEFIDAYNFIIDDTDSSESHLQEPSFHNRKCSASIALSTAQQLIHNLAKP